nr:hypothetical protein [uncultured Duganella sp.]
MPVTIARCGPNHAEIALMLLAAMASAIFVPCRMQTTTLAAKISDTTGNTLAACAVMRSF